MVLLTNIENAFGMKRHRTPEEYLQISLWMERRFHLNRLEPDEVYTNKWAALADKCWTLWVSRWERVDMCEWIVSRHYEKFAAVYNL